MLRFSSFALETVEFAETDRVSVLEMVVSRFEGFDDWVVDKIGDVFFFPYPNFNDSISGVAFRCINFMFVLNLY